jgi:hypothetical protein
MEKLRFLACISTMELSCKAFRLEVTRHELNRGHPTNAGVSLFQSHILDLNHGVHNRMVLRGTSGASVAFPEAFAFILSDVMRSRDVRVSKRMYAEQARAARVHNKRHFSPIAKESREKTASKLKKYAS